jgi:DNA polymerase-1
MVRIHRRMKEAGLRAQMTMQVHDELNFNVPEAEVETLRNIVVTEMQGAMQLQIPLIAECGVGKNWLEAH